jgi:hypothetical protein
MGLGNQAETSEHSFLPASEIVPMEFFIKGFLSDEACLPLNSQHMAFTQRPPISIKHDQVSGLYMLAWVNLGQ